MGQVASAHVPPHLERGLGQRGDEVAEAREPQHEARHARGVGVLHVAHSGGIRLVTRTIIPVVASSVGVFERTPF